MQTRTTLTAAIAAALALSFAMPVAAQSLGSGGSTMREQREKRLKELRGESTKDEDSNVQKGKAKASEAPAAEASRYPNAKRKEPKVSTTRDGAAQLQKIVESFNAKDFAGVIKQADTVIAGSASPYEKAFAERLAGLASAQLKQSDKAISYLKASVDANALDNNPHFDSMSDLAAQYQAAGKNAEALATLDKFLTESGSTDPQYGPMRASLMATTGHSEEAIKLYTDAYNKNPNDIQAVRNLAGTYEASGNTKKAYELLNDARKRGIADEQDYKVLYSGYLVKDKNWKSATEVLDDGVAKNMIPKNDDTARAYMVAAQGAFGDDQWNVALANYTKAASMSSNGEADLNRAKILSTQGKKAESKAAAQAALAKGVKNTADAQRLLK
jgi:hypothetical protein